MCALRTTRALPNGIGRAARCSLLRPGYFGGDEAALQQHSNGATFRRRSFREWPRAPTHSGRRLTREASSRYSSSDEQTSDDCRRFQSQYHSRLSASALVSIVHWNSIIYGLRLPFGRKYVTSNERIRSIAETSPPQPSGPNQDCAHAPAAPTRRRDAKAPYYYATAI